MKKSGRKLDLHRETLRSLERAALRGPNAGGPTTTIDTIPYSPYCVPTEVDTQCDCTTQEMAVR